jgi:DNA-directed RNA polymerase subunit RPC12/RpoP
MASKDIKLKVIPEPAPKSRIVTEAYSGEDEGEESKKANRVNYVCGSCNTIIAKNVVEGSMKGQVVKCTACTAYNEFP